mmetsp:Transcript_76675/g.135895  ORF Transcript_76675/g.135895 Transcript_76675/m.135895 type:complete len:219 (+) Transcript_76675:503-1159(+)
MGCLRCLSLGEADPESNGRVRDARGSTNGKTGKSLCCCWWRHLQLQTQPNSVPIAMPKKALSMMWLLSVVQSPQRLPIMQPKKAVRSMHAKSLPCRTTTSLAIVLGSITSSSSSVSCGKGEAAMHISQLLLLGEFSKVQREHCQVPSVGEAFSALGRCSSSSTSSKRTSFLTSAKFGAPCSEGSSASVRTSEVEGAAEAAVLSSLPCELLPQATCCEG